MWLRSPITKSYLVPWACATQVFYDKLVGIKYGTPEEGDASDKKPPDQQQDQAQTQKQEDAPASGDSAQARNSPASDSSSSVTQRPDVAADKSAPAGASSGTVTGKDVARSTGTSQTGEPAPVTPAAVGASTRVDGASSTADKSAATVTPTVPPNAARPCVKSEGAGGAAGAAAALEGPLRVSMRLSNEMPEFLVVTSKYEEAASFQWRSEMHIQMAFMEEPGG